MAYIQKVTPPPNKILNFSLRDMSGGLNNRSDELKDNESPDLINMMFIDDVLMEKRKGQKYYDALDLASPITFIDEYKPYNDDDVLLRATDSALYAGTTCLSDTLAGTPTGTNHGGRYFFADGAFLKVYGKFPQSTSTYQKVIGTAVDEYMIMKVVTPPEYTPLDTSHVQGVLVVNYDDKTIWYEPCQLELEDPYMGANIVPDGMKYIVSHNGRLFASGVDEDDDNVFISDVNNPFYFPVSMPLQLPPNSDKVVNMIVFDDAVIVGRMQDIYAIRGNTNRPDAGVQPFYLRRINSHTGFASPTSANVAHNYLFFLGSDGNAYALGNTNTEERILATLILSQTIDVKKAPISVDMDDLLTATSVFFQDMWYLSIGDKVLVYSYRNRSWVLFNQLNARSFYVLNNELIWGNDDGRIAMFDDVNYTDFGTPYEAHWYSKRFDMDDANSYKQFREFFIVAHTFEDWDSQIKVVFEVDYSDVSGGVTIENQISLWGISKWGSRLINRNINESFPIVIGRRGRNIRVKLTNGYFVHGTVETYGDLEAYLGKQEGVVVKVIDESAFYLYTKGSWVKLVDSDINQRMKVYQVNGDYELRGKR